MPIRSQRRVILRFFPAFVLILCLSGAVAMGQGDQAGSVPVNGSAVAKHSLSTQPGVGVIWLNLLRNENAVYRAVTLSSASDTRTYGAALSKDVLALVSCAHGFMPDRQTSLRDAGGRVQELTERLSNRVAAGDSADAATSLTLLDIEIERLAALFPEDALPAEVLAQFGAPAPESTLVDSGKQASTDAAPKIAFICPRHPEITSAAPGTCPRCQTVLMELEH